VRRKGGKVVTVPLAPRTARAVDLAIGERLSGLVFIGSDGRRFDRHIASRIVRHLARRAGVNKPIDPHTLRHAFITALVETARKKSPDRGGETFTPGGFSRADWKLTFVRSSGSEARV
jgi:site-specific recombinase XerD